MDLSFGKKYKLCSKIEIDRLFDEGDISKKFPFVCRYNITNFKDNSALKLVISAPKKNFKTAVERNRIKRVCREAVRFNKHILEDWLTENNKQLALFLIYQGKEELTVHQLEQKLRHIFNEIVQNIKNTLHD